MTRNDMVVKSIDPHRFYSSKDLSEMISGFVSIESLRKSGLRALPGSGYWGQAIIDVLNRMCTLVVSDSGVDATAKEAFHDAFFEKRGDGSGRQLSGDQEGQGILDRWQCSRNEGKKVPSGSDTARNIPSQREELFRLTAAELDQGGKHRRGHRRGRKSPVRV